jgi:hypothetical protein
VTTHIDYSNIEKLSKKYELYPKIIHIIVIIFYTLLSYLSPLFKRWHRICLFKIDLTDFDHIISHSAFFLAFESALFNFVTKNYPYIIATINDDIISNYCYLYPI